MRMVDPILMELADEAKTTRRILERVPEDKLTWRPHPKSMSLGQLALHIAGVPAAIAGMAQMDTFDMGKFSQVNPVPASKNEIMTRHDESVAGAAKLIEAMDDAKLMSTWRAVKDGRDMMSMPKARMIRGILLNHWYHHRGQLSVYLRLLDVPLPSIYGPTADENPFAN